MSESVFYDFFLYRTASVRFLPEIMLQEQLLQEQLLREQLLPEHK